MFEKSDKTLFTLRITVTILLVVTAVLSFVMSILYFVDGFVAQGITSLVTAILTPVVGWVMLSFCLACAADVKVIRNKLYKESNAPVAEFFTAADYKERADAYDSTKSELGATLEDLKKLKDLFDSGVLSKDEFDSMKRKYLDNM